MKREINQFTTCLVQFQFKDIGKPKNFFLWNLFHMCNRRNSERTRVNLCYIFNHSTWFQEDGKVDAIQENLQTFTAF